MALVLNLMVLLAETEHSEGGAGLNPWLVGGITLAILMAALFAVLAIGGGRDHT